MSLYRTACVVALNSLVHQKLNEKYSPVPICKKGGGTKTFGKNTFDFQLLTTPPTHTQRKEKNKKNSHLMKVLFIYSEIAGDSAAELSHT